MKKRWKESYLCFCDLIILSSSHEAHFQAESLDRLRTVSVLLCLVQPVQCVSSSDDDGSEHTPKDGLMIIIIIIVPINQQQPGPCRVLWDFFQGICGKD